MSRLTGFISAADALSGAMKEWKLDRDLQLRIALSAWGELVGPQIANASRPLRIKNDIVVIAVPSSVWAQELRFHTTELLERLNARVGEQYFKQIRFEVRTGAFKEKEEERPIPPSDNPTTVELQPEDLLSTNELVQAVENPELREALVRLIHSARQSVIWKKAHGYIECNLCGAVYSPSFEKCPVCVAINRNV
ncbi:MAG: DUF721 domain-containing protein [bacterium]